MYDYSTPESFQSTTGYLYNPTSVVISIYHKQS